MGIPSLNSAIFYRDPSLSLRMTGSCSGLHLNHANITNIPDLVQENSPFHGQETLFPFFKNNKSVQKTKLVSCLC